MRRGNNSSCLGVAIAWFLLLVLWSMVGSTLALPFIVADPESLPASKQPGPGESAGVYGIPVVAALVVVLLASRTRPHQWWVFLARTASLVVLAWVAAAWAETKADAPDGNYSTFVPLMAGGVAFAHHRALLWWDRGGFNGGRRRPAAGEVWLAMVPYRDSDTVDKHYCVIMRNRLRYAEVMQITSQDKSHRSDHIRMPNHGWNDGSDKEPYIEVGLPARRVPYDDFISDKPKGRCPKSTWRELRARRPESEHSDLRKAWSEITRQVDRLKRRA
ncbi:hypothetical protein ACFS5L_30540 [Streptomyces phyllanthi]|uniref:Uncharacterized protein n=1 Tax=Streptomyces phyllanthi TaxID=1803180 RepID=A0A5N8WEL2_9ACTN|nr:hypothetical protein [Streptomyces phyllanthi]MPY44625.1 hypothetical protein [Streptomyces phyllanthi]